MTRDRPAGRRSRRNPSPCQVRTGGVERSTSRTKPGRGMGALLASLVATEIEDDLGGAAAAGGGGVVDGVGVAGQGVGRADQLVEAGRLHQLEGQVEAVTALLRWFGTVGVGAGQP